MKRKVLALMLSMALIGSSTMIVAAAGEVRDSENIGEEISGKTDIEVEGVDKTEDENTNEINVSDEKGLKDSRGDQQESDQNIAGNRVEICEESNEKESDTSDKEKDNDTTENDDNDLRKKLTAVTTLSDTKIEDGDIDFDAVDANGDNYWDSDVELINSLIENNGLNWEKDAPETWDELSGGGIRWDTVDVSGLSRVGWLDISDEGMIGEIDLSELSNLTYLDCRGNELTGLNVHGCEYLEELYCSNNMLSELNLEGLSELRWLEAGGNRLEELILNGNASLEIIGCASNLLTELNLSNFPELESLNCSENKLTELNLSGMPKLSGLYCSGNNLTKLDASTFKKLGTLECSNNGLTELKVSGLVGLTNLECSNNFLTELNLSGLSNLPLAFEENGDTTGMCGSNPLKILTLPAGNTITFDSTDGGYFDVRINPLYASCGQSEEDTVIGFRPVAETGYEFKSWNNLPGNVADSGWWSSPYDGEAVDGWVFVDSGENVTISANFGLISEYSIIDGAGSTWTADSDEDITMRADGEFDKFQSVQVDGVTLDPAYYTAEQGSTIITLKPEFLQTLTPGTHTLTIVFTDGSASAEFDIKEGDQEENPGEEPEEGQKPGDDSKPGDEQQPGDDSKPGDEQQPGEDAGSDDGEQNGDSDKGNSGQQISDPDQNNNNGQGQSKPQQNVNQAKDTDTKDNAATTKTVSSVPKTGDETQVLIFAMFAVASIIICAGISRAKIRTRH